VSGEICTWHRLVDYQPPGSTPDAGHMSFESPERIVEIGVHGAYREVWQRLPGSTGRSIALAEPARRDGQPAARLFLAGHYLMRVRPSSRIGNPAFEITFGTLTDGQWHIERSTHPHLEGQAQAVALDRTGMELARVRQDDASTHWRILQWEN
jgi:hypothetical protein